MLDLTCDVREAAIWAQMQTKRGKRENLEIKNLLRARLFIGN